MKGGDGYSLGMMVELGNRCASSIGAVGILGSKEESQLVALNMEFLLGNLLYIR